MINFLYAAENALMWLIRQVFEIVRLFDELVEEDSAFVEDVVLSLVIGFLGCLIYTFPIFVMTERI